MQFVIATNNKHKVGEIKAVFPSHIKLLTLEEVSINEEIPETADTLEGNALQKARFIHDRLKCNCFADDTGLEVEALNGAPGVYSARYAGEGKSAADNIVKLLKELNGIKNRNAKFRTIIAAIIDGKEYYFEGSVDGTIAEKPMGEKGFGYDPVFVPEGYKVSFAQMTLEEKNTLSHRSMAVKKFIEFLRSNY